MNQLDRLVDLANRTQLPTLVQSAGSAEPCILLPLNLYERLMQDRSALFHQPKQEAPTIGAQAVPSSVAVEIPLAFSESSANTESPKTAFSLQDLLTVEPSKAPVSSSPIQVPQIEALEDRFVFDGPETRILPQIKQKQGFGNPGSGSSEPTLA